MKIHTYTRAHDYVYFYHAFAFRYRFSYLSFIHAIVGGFITANVAHHVVIRIETTNLGGSYEEFREKTVNETSGTLIRGSRG